MSDPTPEGATTNLEEYPRRPGPLPARLNEVQRVELLRRISEGQGVDQARVAMGIPYRAYANTRKSDLEFRMEGDGARRAADEMLDWYARLEVLGGRDEKHRLLFKIWDRRDRARWLNLGRKDRARERAEDREDRLRLVMLDRALKLALALLRVEIDAPERSERGDLPVGSFANPIDLAATFGKVTNREMAVYRQVIAELIEDHRDEIEELERFDLGIFGSDSGPYIASCWPADLGPLAAGPSFPPTGPTPTIDLPS